MATGQLTQAPSQEIIFYDDKVSDGIRNGTNEDINLEESSRDSNEDNLPNFNEDVSNIVAHVNVVNNSSNHSSSGKRKSPQH